MAKIDFTKVEQQLALGIHAIFVKDLMQGKPTISSERVAFYGLDEGARPKPVDTVIQGLKELEFEEVPSPESEEKVPTEIPRKEKIAVSEEVEAPLSPLFLLEQHLRWFKKKKVRDAYKFLGTSKEEVAELRDKKELSNEDNARILAILSKAKEAKELVLKKLDLQDDEKIIEKERKKHITKRFNIRETWLPL